MRDAKALELVETLRRVGYSAVVSDCCDQWVNVAGLLGM
jgi:hypothetical protein